MLRTAWHSLETPPPAAAIEVVGVDVRLPGGVRRVVDVLPFFEGSGDDYSWLSNHFVHAEPWEFRVPTTIVDLVVAEREAESKGWQRRSLRQPTTEA